MAGENAGTHVSKHLSWWWLGIWQLQVLY